ncbi:MAG: coenzyme F420-0:L-glutamate ligase [Clostridiales bacterium]|nr:coenzyme F420-0:L-glutamate ligase [Clostridiales bacterium]MCF8022992.1 coenzyme F420-0:L-glutamate ligase [Clostridiales bacterium]
MSKLPDYVGPAAFGLKMGVIVPNCDLEGMILETLEKCQQDNMLDDRDIICITESVVARSQDNYVTIDRIAEEVTQKLGLTPTSRLGILWPITSRNRFSPILKSLAKAVPQGEIIIQLPYPDDEVGNRIIPPEFIESLGKGPDDIITWEEFGNKDFVHPITGVNYPAFYNEIVSGIGPKPTIYLCNSPGSIADYQPDGVLVANVHTRDKTYTEVKKFINNCITLQDICDRPSANDQAYSEWGLLGSNLSAGERVKLAPRQGDEFVSKIQQLVAERLGKNIEVLIYGDGAYKDPSSSIYELADPQPAFGATDGFSQVGMRKGVKYKYLADLYHSEGKSPEEIETQLDQDKQKSYEQNHDISEGTTPRKIEDLMASLADLVSGSADAGTPVILAKGFINSR